MGHLETFKETSDFQGSTFQQIIGNFTTATEPQRVKTIVYPSVWLYVSPFIFFIGVIGNLLTVLVMRRKRMRRTTTAVYLIVLAIADTLALVTRIPSEFFEAAGVGTFKDINKWTCRFEKFLFYTFSDIAIWVLVLFTIDRFIAVCLPFYKAKLCRPKRSLTTCGVTSIILVGKNLHVFWTRGEEYTVSGDVVLCGRAAYKFEHYIRPWIALTTITLLPFTIIVACNISIVVQLVRARHKVVFHQNESFYRPESSSFSARTSTMSGKTSSTTISAIIPWVRRVQGPTRVFTQTTLMCLSTSVAFLVCVSPSIILTIGRINWSNAAESSHAFGVAQAVNYQLSCLNHAINFFLYCLSGQRFRQELCQLFSRNNKNQAHDKKRRFTDMQKNSMSNSISESNRHDLVKGSTEMLGVIEEKASQKSPNPEHEEAPL